MDIDMSATSLPDPEGLTRADGLWFGDCGLIIQAETTIFRVSRDFLAVHSPVFRDMLALPTPKDAEMMNGCPLVLLPDVAEDVTVFLKALLYYDFFEAYPAPTTLTILTGVLRMSHKYEVDALRKRALVHISSLFPTTLFGYDNFIGKSAPWFSELCATGCFPEIIVLARELGIDWILPVAFYKACQFTEEVDILQGPLTPKDKVHWITACRMLEGAAMNKILAFLGLADQLHDCYSPAVCTASKIAIRGLTDKWRDRPASCAPSMPLDIWKVADWNNLTVCNLCLAHMKSAHRAAKQSFWDGLPSMFGLPEWTELEKMKAEELS